MAKPYIVLSNGPTFTKQGKAYKFSSKKEQDLYCEKLIDIMGCVPTEIMEKYMGIRK